jgi:hypothetical protein
MQRSVSRRVAVALASSWLVVAAGCSPSAEVVGTSADVGVETGAGGSADAGSPDAAEVVGTSADADVEPAGDARPNVDRAARRPTCPVADATCVPVTPAVDVRDACLGVRWVARLRDARAECPAAERLPAGAGTWRVERLFGDDAPTGLRGYCTYSWEPSAGGDPNLVPAKGTDYLEAFGGRLSQGTDAIEVVSKDCLAVGVQDTDVTQAVGRVAESAYYAAVDQVHPLPDGANGGPAAIRVSVVDSTPRGYDEGVAMDGRSDHGLNVGRIVRKIACPGDGAGVNCVGFVSHNLALPMVTPTIATPALGGFFGYQSQLAASLQAAVSDWKAHNAGAAAADETPHERLVINVSLGWEPIYGGAVPAAGPAGLAPPVRAVYDALQHAACNGALVFAAAGNDPGGPTPVGGAMYPAAWEQRPAPTFAQCAALEGAGYAESPSRPIYPLPGVNAYRPLIYGVAGVNHNDFPLANARPGSSGRLVATAQLAATRYEVSPGVWDHTQAISGSSAAAAATSGAAAAVWGYRPELRPYEIAQRLYDSAVSLSPDFYGTARRAKVCQSGFNCGTMNVKRLDVCAALTAACAGAPSLCFAAAAAPACATPAKYTGSGPDLSSVDADYTARLDATFDASALSSGLPGLSACGHTTGAVLYRTRPNAGAYPADACPTRQLYGEGMLPFVGPQPTAPICAECKLGSGFKLSKTAYPKTDGVLDVRLDSSYATSTITNGLVEFLDATGKVQQSNYLRDLGLPATMTAGYAYRVTAMTVTKAPVSVRMSFTVADCALCSSYSRSSVVTLY